MSKNLDALLEQSAQLRCCGASWEAVGHRVNRRASTCRGWPRRYKKKWDALYQNARETRATELVCEAESTLRGMLRDKDPKNQIKSAEVLLKHRYIPPEIPEANAMPDDGQERRTQAEWAKIEQTRAMDTWRQARGLPPYASLEERLSELNLFYEASRRTRVQHYRRMIEMEDAMQPTRTDVEIATSASSGVQETPHPAQSTEAPGTGTGGRLLVSLAVVALALGTLGGAMGLGQEVTPKDLEVQAKQFTRTVEMIPMRDGVKLHTIVYAPKESRTTLPFIMMRTPYGIDTRGPKALKEYFKDLADEGYIFVFQDIRGRHKSEGKFVMQRLPRDPRDAKAIDEGTDTNDTIDWLLKNVPNHNCRVGMLGISYPGWLTVMALLDPHPALKAASPQASPADMFLGDDFHHNGAFRLSYGFEYVAMMETDKSNARFAFDRYDTFEWYLKLGALSNVNPKYFKEKMPTWNDFVAHPNYDDFWKKQASAHFLKRVTMPTLHVAGWFDQEDFYGPLKTYELLEAHDKNNENFLVVGPWNHGGWQSGPGDKLGKITFDSDTGKHFRSKVQAPFFARYLKDKGEKPQEATLFQTGGNQWITHERWPPKAAVTRKLYFHPKGKLAFDPPPPPNPPPSDGGGQGGGFDEYVSDPAKPVPYRPRPVTPTYPGPEWQVWMVEDQRFTQHRPDVLTFETEPLEHDVTLAGSLTAQLFAATSGTDCDWIVRLIDVYPEKVEKQPGMGGYQLLISGEPMRARFRKSFEKPEPVVPDEVNEYTINLHWNHHCFRKGHKIMVQVQSTWFPLIDRNPQKYVPNIFEAKDSDFQTARQRVYHSAKYPSAIRMQVMGK